MDTADGQRESRLAAARAAFAARDDSLATRLSGHDWARFAPLTQSRRYSFYQAMRLLERAAGVDGGDPSALPWRLVQPARDGHVASQLGDVHVDADGGPEALECHFFGLLGPEGPLPEHVTELVREHELAARLDGRIEAGALPDFINVFNHRLLVLFYRIWKSAQPMAQRGEPGDRFAEALDAIGANRPAGTDGDRWHALRRDLCLHFAGGHATVEGLETLVRTVLSRERAMRRPDGLDEGCIGADAGGERGPARNAADTRCRVLENVVIWRETPAALRAALSSSIASPGASVCSPTGESVKPGLGDGIRLGPRHADAQQHLVLRIDTDDPDEYAALLPEGDTFARLRALLREYLAWDFSLTLHVALEPRAIERRARGRDGRLGAGGRLGRDVWLGRPGRDLWLEPRISDTGIAADARLTAQRVVAVPVLH